MSNNLAAELRDPVYLRAYLTACHAESASARTAARLYIDAIKRLAQTLTGPDIHAPISILRDLVTTIPLTPQA